MIHVSLQTHIECPVPLEHLNELPDLGVTHSRISAMTCSEENMLQFILDAESVGLITITTIADPERIRRMKKELPIRQRFWECRNEDDGDIPAEEYREILDAMVAVGQEEGILGFGGVGSNTDEDSLAWGNAVRDCGDGWPAELAAISWHMYGPYPHKGFRRRPGRHPAWAELEWLLAMANGKDVFITEFGESSSGGCSPEQQAESINELWNCFMDFSLYDPHLIGASLFQIYDGPNPREIEHNYGIHFCDGFGNIDGLKPVAYTFPRNM